MPIVYFDRASNPVNDPTDSGTRNTMTLIPPASMVAGQLVVIRAYSRGGADFSISDDGGQTWTELGTGEHQVTNRGTSHAWYCTFNGTWDTDPVIVSAGGAINEQCGMVVFDPPGAGYTWAVDVAEARLDYAAAASYVIVGGTPSDVDTVTVAWIESIDDNEWSFAEGGWLHPSGRSQTREQGGTDSSMSVAYLIGTDDTPTGNLTYSQTSGGTDQSLSQIVTFSAVSANETLGFNVQPANAVEDTVMASVIVESSDTGSVAEVTISLTDAPEVTLSGTLAKLMIAGSVDFDDLEVDTPGTYTFTVEASGHAPEESTSFNITLAPATHLHFHTGPSNTQVDAIISPAVVIRVRNSENIVDTNYTGEVTIARQTGTGVLGGTLAKNAVAGVVTYNDLTYDTVETGVILRVTAAGLTLADSSTFDITTGAAPSARRGFGIRMGSPLTMRL